MKTDIEIAREIELSPISAIAESIGINTDVIDTYGKYIAKVPETLIDEERVAKSNQIGRAHV